MKRPHRLLRLALIITLSFTALLAVGGLILSRYARNKFDDALNAQGISIGSLRINLFNRSVMVEEFSWSKSSDSLSHQSHESKIETIFAGGINIFALLKSERLELSNLTLSNGSLSYNTAMSIKTDATHSSAGIIKGISIDNVKLEKIHFTILNDTLQEYSGDLNLSIGNIVLDDLKNGNVAQSYRMGSFEATLTGLMINARESMYRLNVARIHASSQEKNLVVDSITLLPKLSKYAFSRKIGRQLDRFVLRIPKIDVSGFAFEEIKDSLWVAKLVNIHRANLHIYRDKRLPFIKEHNMPLPIAMIRELPFGVAVDSIKIIESKITYEEFPEQGFETGQIVFEKLNASVDHISNRNDYPNYTQATIRAKARVMGNGLIDAQFSLPYSKSQIYNAKGTISNLAMHRLNPILESLAFISVESGKLNQLSFNFDYDDFTSNGSILINYENLKLIGLTKEKDSDKNKFKTWVMNMFLKKDKDRSVSREKRTGKIYYERDRRRALFNVWVKSLMSGLKSSVLDSPSEKGKDETKKDKKEKKQQDDRGEGKESPKRKA